MGRYFPPGYAFEKERNACALLLALAAGYSTRFFWRLHDACALLYVVEGDGSRVLRPGSQAAPFLEVAAGCWAMFLPLYLFLAAMVAEHYLYYRRQTKSIWLMRRLPERGVLLRTCVQGPLFTMGAGAAAGAVLLALYYGIYLLAMSGECAPGFW